LRPRWRAHVSYADVGRLLDDLTNRGLTVEPEYGADVSLLITADPGRDVREVVAALTQGTAVVEPVGEVAVETPW